LLFVLGDAMANPEYLLYLVFSIIGRVLENFSLRPLKILISNGNVLNHLSYIDKRILKSVFCFFSPLLK
jgi:hypothetical protein